MGAIISRETPEIVHRSTAKLHTIFYCDSSLHDIEGPPRYEHIHHFFSVLIEPEPGEHVKIISPKNGALLFSPCQAWRQKRQNSYC